MPEYSEFLKYKRKTKDKCLKRISHLWWSFIKLAYSRVRQLKTTKELRDSWAVPWMSLVNNSDDNKKAELFSTSEPLEMLSASSAEGYSGNGQGRHNRFRREEGFLLLYPPNVKTSSHVRKSSNQATQRTLVQHTGPTHVWNILRKGEHWPLSSTQKQIVNVRISLSNKYRCYVAT